MSCKEGSCEKQIEGSLTFLNPKNIFKKREDSITSEYGYEAPEFKGLTNWINSEPIESIGDLKGKVVMLEFWTLGCINCIRTHEHTQKMYEKYKDQGLVVLGLHAPEFAYERLIENVQASVDEYGMTYPVAQDNDFMTWKAFNNRYWPAFYFIDVEGKIRYTHFGEGKYDEKEKVIQELLAEKNKAEYGFDQDNLKTNTALYSIELDEILDGGPGKDGIPAINNPKFITQEEVQKSAPYLGEDDLGIVLEREGEARFYGYDVLVWHEIVNDEIAGEKVSVTFCPLCGSAIIYDRMVNGREIDFGVSGKLYNSNLLMYDTYDESLWSQSLGEAVVGNQLGTKLDVVKSELMSYTDFVKLYPEGKVLSNDTGFSRSYGQIPYGNYDDSEDLFFPVNTELDSRFHPKKLFYIVNDEEESLAFAWDDIREEGEASIQVGDTTYSAIYQDGILDVEKQGEILPGYFEMWFSWTSHNEGNKNIWSK